MAMPADVACNPLHGESDAGHTIVGTLLSGAAILAAAYNAYRAVELATQEWKMAKKYWQIAQNWLDYYKDYYAPVEDQELHEARNIDLEQLMYDAARGRARATAFLEFRGVLDQAVRCTSRYCTGLRSDMLAEMTAAQAASVAMADGLGYRNERAYVEARNDVRFKKMLNTAKRGRDMIADNVSLVKSTAGIYGDLFEQTWVGLEGAGQYLGYYNNRNKTRYPTTYVQGRAQQYAKAKGETAEASKSGEE